MGSSGPYSLWVKSKCGASLTLGGVYAEIVSDVQTTASKVSYAEQALENARAKLNRFLPRAVEIITELAETSENDRVRLAAAESIADRAGLGKSSTTRVETSSAEHEAARREAEDVVAKLRRNQAAQLGKSHEIPLDTLIVHEGLLDEEPLTVAST